jgi:tetratricopeptide (TPR) repeat protein
VAGRWFECRIGALEGFVKEGFMARAWRTAVLAAIGVLSVCGVALADGGGGGGGGGDQARRAKAQDPAMAAAVQTIDAGQYARAIPMLQEIVTRQPGNADAYNWLAYATRKNGDPAKSIAIYEKALAIDPKHLGAHEYIGEAYLALDDLPKAKEHLRGLREERGQGEAGGHAQLISGYWPRSKMTDRGRL